MNVQTLSIYGSDIDQNRRDEVGDETRKKLWLITVNELWFPASQMYWRDTDTAILLVGKCMGRFQHLPLQLPSAVSFNNQIAQQSTALTLWRLFWFSWNYHFSACAEAFLSKKVGYDNKQ